MCVLLWVWNFHCVCWWWDVSRKVYIPTLQHCEGTSICWFGHWQKANCVNINTQKHDDGSFELIQCALINSITDDVCHSYVKAIPKPKQLLSKSHSTPPKTLLPLTMTLIATQSHATSTVLIRQHDHTSFMLCICLPISQILEKTWKSSCVCGQVFVKDLPFRA